MKVNFMNCTRGVFGRCRVDNAVGVGVSCPCMGGQCLDGGRSNAHRPQLLLPSHARNAPSTHRTHCDAQCPDGHHIHSDAQRPGARCDAGCLRRLPSKHCPPMHGHDTPTPTALSTRHRPNTPLMQFIKFTFKFCAFDSLATQIQVLFRYTKKRRH